MADIYSGPDNRSSESRRMLPAWTMISDVIAGAAAVRAKGREYLPKYDNETDGEYERRRKTAPWRPEFVDALRSLASRPFGKDVGVRGNVPDEVKTVAEDIDGRGNSLTAFSAETFGKAIAKGMHAILVDYPTMDPGATRADEQKAGARPYWIQVQADDIIALYTTWQGGIEIVSHVRLHEVAIIKDGFGEKKIDRIRVMEPGRWEIWEKAETADQYARVSDGVIDRGGGHNSVPLVLFYTGERNGELAVKPPLLDLAQLQIELYQALSRQDEILTYAGSPMLAAIGFKPPTEGTVSVGPKQVLFAPQTGDVATDWKFVQPDARNIEEVRKHVESITADMRRLGMQPITPHAGRPTATGQQIEAAKSHTSVRAWAMGLKDALEQAFVFTAEWMAIKTNVECDVSTDFSVEPYADAPLAAIDKARARRDISIETYWDSLRRFDVLPPDFDHIAETAKVEAEWKRFGATVERDPATGRKIDVSTIPAPRA